MCFFVRVIFFLSLYILQTNPMQCSLYCSDVYIQFTFLLHFSCCNFFSRCKSRVTVLFILLSVLLPLDLFRPLFFFRSELVFSMYSTVDLDSFKSMAILLMLRPSARFFWMHFTSLNLIVLPRNLRTIYAVRFPMLT